MDEAAKSRGEAYPRSMTPTMTHVALHVHDFEACMRFYREYCGMHVVHERQSSAQGSSVVWLSEPGREHELIFVLIPGGSYRDDQERDFSHLGFAVEAREAVDQIAERARSEGRLIWEPTEEDYPVGYYCGVRDPDGNHVEFSYGQPLGPGAEKEDRRDLPGSRGRGGERAQ
jgi:catechol 2,3-dioxygenase-like lactoylglutathione lyase family enzyme